MTNIRRSFTLAGVVIALFLTVAGVHAQEIAPRSYLFVEVKDVNGQAISDATVRISNAGGKQLLNAKTYQQGTLQTSFHQQYDHHYDIQIAKPGYLPYEQVVFPNYPSAKLVALIADLSGAGDADYPNGPPIRIALRKETATPAESRAVAGNAHRRKRARSITGGCARKDLFYGRRRVDAAVS